MYYCYILGKYRQALEVGQYASKILTYIGQFKKEVGMYTNTARVASRVCVNSCWPRFFFLPPPQF